MNRNFIKTNWFYMAMGLLLLCYTARKYPRLNPFNASGKGLAREKITDGKESKKGGAALLGFVPDDAPAKAPRENGVENEKTEAFLKRFAKVAVSEHKKFGMPASIILACACVNSQSGELESATSANNFFALPCSDGWEGESARSNGECFRKYETPWASFRDFSIFLSSQEWFGSLKKSAGKDWSVWVEKLGDENISKAKAMKQIIETYNLAELD